VLSLLGGVSEGLVWGWLTALFLGRGPDRPSVMGRLAVAAATAVLFGQQVIQAHGPAAACFLAAAGIAALFQLGWLRRRRRG